MKVTFFTNSLSREGGGLFHSVRSLAKNIRNSDCEVNVFSPSDPHQDQDRAMWGDIHTVTYHRLLAFKVRSKLSQIAPDIIHLNGIWLPHSQIIHSFSQSQGVPQIISPRGMLDPWALRNARFKKTIAGWLFEYRNLRNASCIHALCESEYKAIRAFGLKQPVAIIPNGVNPPLSDPDRKNLPWPYPEEWREHQILLFLSRIHPKKGLIPLIHAWQQSIETNADWRLAIVGPDENDHIKDILRLVEDYGLKGSVAWIGPQYGKDRTACYHHADAFILPSYSEGLPMAVLEALSFNLPAILTPECHLPETIDVGAALLTEPTENDIAEKLRELFSLERSSLVDMGQKGSQLVKTSFSWASISKRMIAVYKWLVAPDSHPMPADVRVD